jgi:hypothetical protein
MSKDQDERDASTGSKEEREGQSETYGEALLAVKASVDLVLHSQGSRHAVVRPSVLHNGVHPGLHLRVALGCVLLCSVGAKRWHQRPTRV